MKNSRFGIQSFSANAEVHMDLDCGNQRFQGWVGGFFTYNFGGFFTYNFRILIMKVLEIVIGDIYGKIFK